VLLKKTDAKRLRQKKGEGLVERAKNLSGASPSYFVILLKRDVAWTFAFSSCFNVALLTL